MKRLSFLTLVFSFCFMLSFVCAEINYQDFGLSLGYKEEGILKINQDYQLNIHVYNSSNGFPLSNSSVFCALHLYNQSGKHILVNNNLSFSPLYDFNLDILGSNFSEEGSYPYVVACFSNDFSAGAVFSSSFTVTNSGTFFDTSESLLYVIILLFITLFLIVGIYVSIVVPYGNIEEITPSGQRAVKKVTKTKYLKLMAMWFSYGMFLLLITVLAGMTNNYIQFIEVKNLFNNSYLFLKILSYGVSVAMIWLLFWNGWKDIILNKTILREGKALLNRL